MLKIELNKIYNEDCLEGMKRIPDNSVDLIITDPPYGIDFQSQWTKDKSKRKKKILNDKKPFVEFLPEIKRLIKSTGAIMIFTRWDVQQQFIDCMTANGMKPKNILIWDKVVHGMGDLKKAYGSRYESIIFWANDDFKFNGKRPTDIIRQARVSANRLVHPNEKPTELIETLVTQTSKSGGVVFDPFMGSGTTAIACINTNRNYIGFELDEHYYNIATERINNHVKGA